MGTETILAMLLAMQLALNVGKHQRKTSQTLGVNGPLSNRASAILWVHNISMVPGRFFSDCHNDLRRNLFFSKVCTRKETNCLGIFQNWSVKI